MPAALFIPHACRRCFLCLSPRVAAWQLRIATLIRSYIIPTHTQDLYNTIQYIRPNERAQRYEVAKRSRAEKGIKNSAAGMKLSSGGGEEHE